MTDEKTLNTETPQEEEKFIEDQESQGFASEGMMVYAAIRLHDSGNHFIDFGSCQLTPDDCMDVVEFTAKNDPEFHEKFPFQYLQKLIVIPVQDIEDEEGEEDGG